MLESLLLDGRRLALSIGKQDTNHCYDPFNRCSLLSYVEKVHPVNG